MFFLLKTFNKFISLLNSETAPSQLAAGLAFGMIVGFSPFFTWHNLFVFLLVCLLRVNFAMFFLSTAVCSILAFALDPLFDWFGYLLLVDWRAARPLWVYISTAPLLPFFRLNNTVVLGSLAVSLILFIPVFISFVFFVKAYRQRWRERMANSRLIKSLKATKLYGCYVKFESFRDKWRRLT